MNAELISHIFPVPLGWMDRWWQWLWIVLKEITLISVPLSSNGQRRSACAQFIYMYMRVHTLAGVCQHVRGSLRSSVWRPNLSKAWKSWVYCCLQSAALPEVSMATERVKVRLEVSREFGRDREKDFVLPHKDSFQALNMTERISKWSGRSRNWFSVWTIWRKVNTRPTNT